MKSNPLKRIDVGITRVNLGWNGHRFSSTWDAFDPCINLNAAARILRECWERSPGSWLKAAGCYHHPAGGKTAALLSPDYEDLDDPRAIFDWQQVISQRGIVYVGLDALSDSEVGAAVGNSIFADLVSIAGHIYKHGINDGLPENGDGKLPSSLHCDVFNELMGDEFIPLINKGGAGIEVTAYPQTISDIKARIGSSAKAAQVTGNFNTLIMLRVRENRTAELLTSQLPEVDVYSKTLVSGYTNITKQEQGTDFTSNTQDRVSMVKTPMLTPADIINLPKGQAFALLEGGQLWKIRMPLPAADKTDLMPKSLQKIAAEMRRNYRTSEAWWSGAAGAELPGGE